MGERESLVSVGTPHSRIIGFCPVDLNSDTIVLARWIGLTAEGLPSADPRGNLPDPLEAKFHLQEGCSTDYLSLSARDSLLSSPEALH